MSAKYKTLVSLYSTEIAEVKRLKAIAEAADAAIQDEDDGEDEADAYVRQQQAYAAWNVACERYQVALEALTSHVREEYAEVPFGKSAEAGVDAFFREAGL